MKPLLIVSALVTTYMCYVEGQSCTTPSGLASQCVSIYDCQPLLNIVRSQKPEDRSLLTKSSCGYVNNLIKVCCPPAEIPCQAADGKQGVCVNVYDCPHINNMLMQRPVSTETRQFVQNSRCNGKDQYSVCCGPPPEQTQVTPVTPEPSGTGAAWEVRKPQCVTSSPNDLTRACCGNDGNNGNKLLGGNATGIDQYPWMTLIEYKKGSDPIQLLCGGTLISARYVLTAGHCVKGIVLSYGTPINVRLGEYDTENAGEDCVPVEGGDEGEMDCTKGIVTIPIDATIPHPAYDPRSSLRRNDIALIRLRQLAPYNDFIRPICLPASDISLDPKSDMRLMASGWGRTENSSSSNIKLQVQLPFVSMEVCQPSYNVPVRRVQLWTGQICAGGEPGKDSCKGDSGGPLMLEGQKYEIAGVVSFGPTPCGLPNVPGVYTKVFHYLDWIKQTAV